MTSSDQEPLQVVATGVPTDSPARRLLSAGAEALLASVPVVGGALAVGFNRAMAWSLEARMEDFFEELAQAVALQGRAVEGLASDPTFVDDVVRATRIAQGSSYEEKRAWLCNAVVNTLRADAPDQAERLRCFRAIDQLLPAHVRILRFLRDPTDQPPEYAQTPGDELADDVALAGSIPELAGNPDHVRGLIDDLVLLGLVDGSSRMDFTAKFDGRPQPPYSFPSVTQHGFALLKFIEHLPTV